MQVLPDHRVSYLTRLATFRSAATQPSTIPHWVYQHAKVASMDWLGVTLAGKDNPLVDKLLNLAEGLGGKEQASERSNCGPVIPRPFAEREILGLLGLKKAGIYTTSAVLIKLTLRMEADQ